MSRFVHILSHIVHPFRALEINPFGRRLFLGIADPINPWQRFQIISVPTSNNFYIVCTHEGIAFSIRSQGQLLLEAGPIALQQREEWIMHSGPIGTVLFWNRLSRNYIEVFKGQSVVGTDIVETGFHGRHSQQFFLHPLR